MSLDIAMGGSSNTVLHLLAAAPEAGGGFKTNFLGYILYIFIYNLARNTI